MNEMITATIIALAALASTLILAWTLTELHHSHRQLRRFLARLAQSSSRIRKEQADYQELRHKKKLLEDSVNSGATAVETIHRIVTSSTFGMLDRLATSDTFRGNVRQIRSVHDETSRTFYRSLRSTNKTLHALTNLVMASRRRRINPDER